MSRVSEYVRRRDWQRRLQAAADDVEFWGRMLGLARQTGAIFRPYESEFLAACEAHETLRLEYAVAFPDGEEP